MVSPEGGTHKYKDMSTPCDGDGRGGDGDSVIVIGQPKNGTGGDHEYALTRTLRSGSGGGGEIVIAQPRRGETRTHKYTQPRTLRGGSGDTVIGQTARGETRI